MTWFKDYFRKQDMQIATFMAWMEATRNMYIKKSNGIVLEGPTNAGKTMILNTLLGTMELEPIPRTNDNSSFHLDQLIFATRVLFEEPCTIQALAGTDEHMTILLTKWMKLFVSKNGIVLASVDESYDIVTDKSVGLTPAMWVQMFTECEAIITTMPNKINDANELLSLDMHILADRHGFRPEYGQLDYSNLKRLIDKHCKGTIVIVNGEEKANVLRKYHQPTINAAVLGIPAWTSISMGHAHFHITEDTPTYYGGEIARCESWGNFDDMNTGALMTYNHALDPDGEIGYFFIVDLEYPHQIHNDTADFPLAPEHMLIDDSLLTDFMNGFPNKERPSEKLLLNQFKRKEREHDHYTGKYRGNVMYVNNLYGQAMTWQLPKNNFHYVNEFDFVNTDINGKTGYFFVVDLKYPHAIHDEIVDLPLAQEHMKIYDSLLTEYMTAQPNKEKPSEKLLLNQFDKIEYKVFYPLLKGRHSSSIGEPTIPSALSEPIILDKTIPPTRKRKRLFKIMDSESDEEFPSMSQSIILDDDEPPIGKRRYSDKILEPLFMNTLHSIYPESNELFKVQFKHNSMSESARFVADSLETVYELTRDLIVDPSLTYARYGKLQAGKPGVIISQSTYKLILDHRRTLTTTIGTGSNLTIKLNKWSSIISTQRGMMIKSFDDNDRLLPDKCIGISSDMFRKLFFEMESDITQQPLISSDVLDEIQRLEDALTADGNDGGPVLERMVNIELEKEIPPALGETSIPSTSQQSEPTISRASTIMITNSQINALAFHLICLERRHSSSIREPTIPSALSEPIILDKAIPPTRKRKSYGKLQAGKPGVIISQSTYKRILDHQRTLTTTIGTGNNLTIKLNKWGSIISTQRGMMIKSVDDNDKLLPDICIEISSDIAAQQPLISSDVLDEIQRLEDALTADGNDGGPALERMVTIELEKEILPALGETSIPSTSQQSEIAELVSYISIQINQDVGPQSDIEEFMDFAIRLVKYAPSAIRYQELMARNLVIDEPFIQRIIDAAVLEHRYLQLLGPCIQHNVPFYERIDEIVELIGSEYAPTAIRYQELMAHYLIIDMPCIQRIIDAAVLEVYFDNCSLDISSYWIHVSSMNVPFYESIDEIVELIGSEYAPTAIRYQELMAHYLIIDVPCIQRIIDAAVLEVYFDNCSLDISSYWIHVSSMNVPFYERIDEIVELIGSESMYIKASGLEPFRFVTVSSACMATFKSKFCQELFNIDGHEVLVTEKWQLCNTGMDMDGSDRNGDYSDGLWESDLTCPEAIHSPDGRSPIHPSGPSREQYPISIEDDTYFGVCSRSFEDHNVACTDTNIETDDIHIINEYVQSASEEGCIRDNNIDIGGDTNIPKGDLETNEERRGNMDMLPDEHSQGSDRSSNQKRSNIIQDTTDTVQRSANQTASSSSADPRPRFDTHAEHQRARDEPDDGGAYFSFVVHKSNLSDTFNRRGGPSRIKFDHGSHLHILFWVSHRRNSDRTRNRIIRRISTKPSVYTESAVSSFPPAGIEPWNRNRPWLFLLYQFLQHLHHYSQ
ncbi:Non-structural protein NS1 [Nymphon striatum]|nr:Non-structural protein NS1 [Nymphon striatum]